VDVRESAGGMMAEVETTRLTTDAADTSVSDTETVDVAHLSSGSMQDEASAEIESVIDANEANEPDLVDGTIAAVAGAGAVIAGTAASGAQEQEQLVQQQEQKQDYAEFITQIHREMYQNDDGRQRRVVIMADVCQDCAGLCADDSAIVLGAGQYEKLGTIHCGVTRPGFVAVGGDVSTIVDSQVVLFRTHKVAVCRNGDNHTFIAIAE
ncbi:MAG: hypothetical protein ACPGSM_12530, partial [Thiolinea sp.]